MSSLIVCHACDLVHRLEFGAVHARVRCSRCRAELYRTTAGSIDTAIAVAISALVLLCFSNAYPLVKFEVNGTSTVTTLLGAAAALYGQGYTPMAVLVLVTTEIVPLLQIVLLLYLLIPLRLGRHAHSESEFFRVLAHLRPWGMPEVFLLGTLVALVKLAAIAQVIPGISLFAYGALMLCLSVLTSLTPTEQFWRWLESTP